jgi:hypothetical protein
MVVLTIFFATSNEALITLYLWPLEGALTAPTWLVVLSSFIIGGLLSITLLLAQSLTIRLKMRNLQAKLNKLQSLTDTERISKDSDSDSNSKDQKTKRETSKTLSTSLAFPKE